MPSFWKQEIPTDQHIIENTDKGYSDYMKNPYREERAELLDIMMEKLAILTPRQKEITLLFLDSKTKSEIATILSISRSTVSKHLHGNSGHGGIVRKLRKHMLRDSRTAQILFRIAQIDKDTE